MATAARATFQYFPLKRTPSVFQNATSCSLVSSTAATEAHINYASFKLPVHQHLHAISAVGSENACNFATEAQSLRLFRYSSDSHLLH